MLRRIWRATIPRSTRTFLFDLRSHIRILEFETGHFRSSNSNACVDKNGNPLPWYTYPAIEYIGQLDFSNRTVFEYGSGNSSLFWNNIAARVISIEDNPQWYEKVLGMVKGKTNAEIKFIVDQPAYTTEILNHDDFDVIIVDGSYRLECARTAVRRLKSGGMIILDNADRFVKSAKFLRESGLIQVDMIGFGPLLHNTAATSFFLDRNFNFQPRHPNQPDHGIGSPKQIDEPD